MAIKNVCVIGSGVMGSGIAALCANAGLKVSLLDIVPDGAEDRNALAKGAIEKQNQGGMPGFTYKKNAKLIAPGNLEDDLAKIAEADWIIEVVLERLDVKHDVYGKIEANRKKGSIVSSNTSTIPLAELVKPMSDQFKKDFCITHFFNPPRFMRLLELVVGEHTSDAVVKAISGICDVRLGKGVVVCKDTPGFLGNRIGVYWLMVGLLDAIEMGIDIEDADAVMGKPVGIPKTGVFGLFDLIGIDLMPHIAKSMLDSLPEKDHFRAIYSEPERVSKMIADGYTGRKGKGGFYRLNKEGGKKVKESIDLKTGEYSIAKKPNLESVKAGRLGLAAVVGHPDIGGQYAASVLFKTLHYAASLIPEISDEILSVDQAMKWGYNWKYGPFELIDRLKWDGHEGTAIFAQQCEKHGVPVPELIQKVAGKPLYKEEGGDRFYFGLDGEYHRIERPAGSAMLLDFKRGNKEVYKTATAKAWDIGDGILAVEHASKGNTFDPENLKLITKLPQLVQEKGFQGVVFVNDSDHYSFGANIGYFMMACNTASWWAISDMVKQGQDAYMGLKYAPFPVVGALSGMALGGGCELMLHCDAVQAHMESYIGLVEVGIGVIPGWGGCKELVLRHMALADRVKMQVMAGEKPEALMPQGPMPAISKAFEYISMAKVAGSAQEAQEMLILNHASGLTMNRERVLPDAKARCLKLADDYTPPEMTPFNLPGPTGKAALDMAVDNFVKNGKATAHDEVVSKALAAVLTGGDCDITDELNEQHLLDLEHDLFMELVHTKGTQDRIAHMLATSKPLRN